MSFDRLRMSGAGAWLFPLLAILPLAFGAPARAMPPAVGPASKATGRPAVALPEGFAGNDRAVMTALYPRWDFTTEATGERAGDEPKGARLREAKRWVTDGRSLLAVLVDTWAGSAHPEPVEGRCDGATCDAQPTELAVLELRGRSLAVVGRLEAGKHGGGVETALDAGSPRISPERMLLGVRVSTRDAASTTRVLRLYSASGGSVTLAFERTVEAIARPAKGRKPAGCTATVRSDEFGTPPYPLKVVEHCTRTGKTSTERWRWNGMRYNLHGPASDADVTDEDFTTVVDEPSN